MAVFGQNDFGSPFGAIRPSEFFTQPGQGSYSYQGFSSLGGATGFSGECNSTLSPSILPPKPTLTYPLNYDKVYGMSLVTWKRGTEQECSSYTYEIQITRSFSRDSGWLTLFSNIPSSSESIEVDFQSIPATFDGGIRIRAVDENGLASGWSTNITSFAISDHLQNKVKILAPLGGEDFDTFVSVVWREAEIKSIDGRPVTYTVQITPAFSTDLGWVDIPNAVSLLEGTTSFIIDSYSLPDGDDYGIRVVSIDDLGNISPAESVGPIKIKHNGVFIIDTTPPGGNVTINDGDPLAKDRRVKLDLFGFDATTDIKDIRIKNADEECWSSWDIYSTEKFWDLSSSDGLKRVLVQFRDYAGNISEACDCEIVSRVLCREGNATDLEVFNTRLYVSFDANGNVLEYKALFKQVSGITQPQILAMSKLDNALYIGAYDPSEESTSVYRYDSIATLAFSLSGKVKSMASFNNKVYIGMNDGRILSYDGSALSTSNSQQYPISRLRVDGFILYASLEDVGEYLTYNGSVWVSHAL